MGKWTNGSDFTTQSVPWGESLMWPIEIKTNFQSSFWRASVISVSDEKWGLVLGIFISEFNPKSLFL